MHLIKPGSSKWDLHTSPPKISSLLSYKTKKTIKIEGTGTREYSVI